MVEDKNPSPVETRRAEREMTPKQRVMTRARYDIISHAEDLRGVGVSSEQIKQAAEKAGTRAKFEFEQKEKQDPLRRLVEMLNEAAETEVEKKFAEAGEKEMEGRRQAWAQFIAHEKERASHDNRPFDIKKAMLEPRTSERQPGYFAREKSKTSGSIEYFPTFLVLPNEISEKGEVNAVPKGLSVRLLQNLGALDKGQTVADLQKELPSPSELTSDGLNGYKDYDGPVLKDNVVIDRLPTDIEGVTAGYNLGSGHIWVRLNMSAFEKSLDFPTS